MINVPQTQFTRKVQPNKDVQVEYIKLVFQRVLFPLNYPLFIPISISFYICLISLKTLNFLFCAMGKQNQSKIHQEPQKITRKLSFHPHVSNTMRNHQKQSIADGRHLKFIMVDFSQNIPFLLKKTKNGKVKCKVQTL